MSNTYISASLRRLVTERAGGRCEYWRIDISNPYFCGSIDHIISEKDGGPTTADNLALACSTCNAHKGPASSSVAVDGRAVRLYDPRRDRWGDHFRLDGVRIVPLTEAATLTVRAVALNAPDRLLQREALRERGLYPSK